MENLNSSLAASHTTEGSMDLPTLLELITQPSIHDSLLEAGQIPTHLDRVLNGQDEFLHTNADQQIEEIVQSNGSLLGFYYIAGKLTPSAMRTIMGRLAEDRYVRLLHYWLYYQYPRDGLQPERILATANIARLDLNVRRLLYQIHNQFCC